MIISFTVMSKNASLEKLAQELAVMGGMLDDSLLENNQSIILARVLPGVSSANWQTASKRSGLENWHALPARGEVAQWDEALELKPGTVIPVTPFREIRGIISRGMFSGVLHRELKRLARSGGSMSLLSVGIANQPEIRNVYGASALAHLEAYLASIFLSLLDICDSIGILRRGQYICCMPGIGQLAARNLAEKAQKEFADKLPETLTDIVVTKAQPVECAIGIVNLLQGESGNVKSLLTRSSLALEMAISRDRHIYQESTVTPLENTTLVQSSEKQFLFFGSNRP